MPISSKSGKQQERVSAVKIVKFFSLAGRFYGTSVANRAPKYENTNPPEIQQIPLLISAEGTPRRYLTITN